jgi:hypothetical protein
MGPKISRILALLATLVLLGTGCSSGGDTDTGTKSEAEAFTSTEGRFSAEFPSDPDEQTQNTAEGGIDLTVHFFTSETDDYAVSVGYVDYPAEFAQADPKVVLSGVAEGAAGNVQGGEVTKNNPSTFLDLPAVDYEVKATGAELQAKAFLKENRLYILQGVSEQLADADAEYDQLVESFKLL